MEPTPWATYDDVVQLCPPCASMPNDTVMVMALQVATEILYELTGRQWPGIRTTLERPIFCFCGCQRASECSCGFLSEVTLSRGPVISVQQVKVYGDVVDPARYRLDGGNRLVWRPDLDPAHQNRWGNWPACQMLDRADTEDFTWSVAYTYGRTPPAGGKMAAASLACQLALALAPAADEGGACRLPTRVTNITRQGVSMVVLDPLTLIQDGMVGLAEVDLWVSSVIKGRQRRGGAIMVPGRPRGRIIG